jgi:hypothetical protein
MSSDVCQCSDEPHDMCVAVSHAVRCSTAPCRAVQVACCAVLRWVVLGGKGSTVSLMFAQEAECCQLSDTGHEPGHTCDMELGQHHAHWCGVSCLLL